MTRNVRLGLAAGLLSVACYALIALLVVPVYPHFVSPNEFSRWAATSSIVERGSPEISWLLPLLGPRLEDISEIDGRRYSNKAPGGSFFAIPAYALAHAMIGPPGPATLRTSLFLCRIWTSTIPLLLLGALLAYAAGKTGARPRRIALTVAALLFATPLFAYGLLFFSHALSALCVFGAWALLYLPAWKGSLWRALGAGALCGVAVLNEYTTAVPIAVFLAGLLVTGEWRRAATVIAGGAPFAIILALYQKLTFGSFVAVSSGHERFDQFRELAESGFFGIGFPSASNLVAELLSPSRGLLLMSPFLLMLPLWITRARRRLPGAAIVTLLVAPVLLLLVLSGYPNWHGGWGVGLRYLVPVIPLLVFPMVYSPFNRLETALIGASAAAVTITTFGFSFVPPEIPFPWVSLSGRLLLRDLSVPVWTDLIAPPLVGRMIVLALLVAVAFGTTPRRRRARHLAWMAFGAAVWIATPMAIFNSRPLNPLQRLEAAYIEQTYFDQPGAMTREFPDTPLPPGLIRRHEMERQLPPPAWPGHGDSAHPAGD
ncbi:MAG: hypothetical protein KY459_03060 [Acidobacteria bacterium]|nr:hypothetical protein [Acidobacteriota bacterium]